MINHPDVQITFALSSSNAGKKDKQCAC
ncbi:MAG: hypothetical protein WDM90_18070 [Ferruginibacter sp.]